MQEEEHSKKINSAQKSSEAVQNENPQINNKTSKMEEAEKKVELPDPMIESLSLIADDLVNGGQSKSHLELYTPAYWRRWKSSQHQRESTKRSNFPHTKGAPGPKEQALPAQQDLGSPDWTDNLPRNRIVSEKGVEEEGSAPSLPIDMFSIPESADGSSQPKRTLSRWGGPSLPQYPKEEFLQAEREVKSKHMARKGRQWDHVHRDDVKEQETKEWKDLWSQLEASSFKSDGTKGKSFGGAPRQPLFGGSGVSIIHDDGTSERYLAKTAPAFSFASKESARIEKTMGPSDYDPLWKNFKPSPASIKLGQTSRFPTLSHSASMNTPGPMEYMVKSEFSKEISKGTSFGHHTLAQKLKARKSLELATGPQQALVEMSTFGFGCNLEEHCKYGACLDGKCCERALWERTNKLRLSNLKQQEIANAERLQRRKQAHTQRTPGVCPWEKGSKINEKKKKKKQQKQAQIHQKTVKALRNDGRPGSRLLPRGALHYAVSYEDLDLAHKLLHEGADPDQRDEQGMSALHIAANLGFAKLVVRMLDNEKYPFINKVGFVAKRFKPNLDLQDVDGNTPLHLAAKEGHITVVEKLLLAGADQGVINKKSHTPLEVTNDHAVFQVLRQHADVISLKERLAYVKTKEQKIRNHMKQKEVQRLRNEADSIEFKLEIKREELLSLSNRIDDMFR